MSVAKYTVQNTTDGRQRSRVDITGMRSGKLVAIEPTDKRYDGSVIWKCRCDCGKEVEEPASKILRGTVKSCGCGRIRSRALDLTGKRFGSLTALERLDQKQGSSWLWKCKCDCGNITTASASALSGGRVQSCGCMQTTRLRASRDVTGEHFGRLTALYPTEKRAYGGVVWICACECGKEVEVPLSQLTSGNVQSCGCLKKDHPAPPLDFVDGTCIQSIRSDKKKRKDNKSGVTGVFWNGNRKKWQATLSLKNKRYILGFYDNFGDAAAARRKAEQEYFRPVVEAFEQETRANSIQSESRKEV